MLRAGKHGFVETKQGHLYFEDGLRARFLGFNVAADQTPQTTKRLIKWQNDLKVWENLIRLHAADAPVGEEPGELEQL